MSFSLTFSRVNPWKSIDCFVMLDSSTKCMVMFGAHRRNVLSRKFRMKTAVRYFDIDIITFRAVSLIENAHLLRNTFQNNESYSVHFDRSQNQFFLRIHPI